MISRWIPPRLIFWASVGVILALGLGKESPAAASMPYLPLFEFTAISSSAPGANADITFKTSLPAGHHIVGLYGLETPDNWSVAGHSNQLNGDVTAVGTLTVNLEPDGNCNDGDSGTPQTYGPFHLNDQDPGGGGGPHAIWTGLITDFGDGNPTTSWGITLTIEPLEAAYTIDGFLTDAIPPAGNAVCTPQVFTLTLCGRANPTPTATVCGSGSNEVVMTNPPAAGCHVWRLVTTDDSGQHSAGPQAGVSISGTPCDADFDGVADPTDNCPRWPNPAQNLPPWTIGADDPDCDGFSSAVENSVGTYPFTQCGFNAWPADINNNIFSDTGDLAFITGNFGKSVPPAPARYNIAPDPPDTFIDTADIAKMNAYFGDSCVSCPGDIDCDSAPDVNDNCRNWSNPSQALPPWPVPANDPDCDGFSSGVENSVGTAPLVHCGTDAWPADINNNGFSDTGDLAFITANFGKSVPPAPARYNIAPDPVDTFIDTADIAKMNTFFGKQCF